MEKGDRQTETRIRMHIIKAAEVNTREEQQQQQRGNWKTNKTNVVLAMNRKWIKIQAKERHKIYNMPMS